MIYFVTGATGFIGKRLVKRLLARKGSVVYFLLRPESEHKTPALLEYWSTTKARAISVIGDLSRPNLGVSPTDLKILTGQVDHFFHLAAMYDLAASAEQQVIANVEGTRHAVALANRIAARCFHHTSSIAAAGLFEGIFREDMFEEAEGLDHPYFSSKHDAEAIARKDCNVPLRIYRPAMVIGDSRSGEMDKIDGPYYFFKLIQTIRKLVPSWVPMIGLEGGRINIVPVDFVVEAMDFIAHQSGLDGRCFHLTDPEPMRVGDVLNTFAKAGHAPLMSLRINAALLGFIPKSVKKGLMSLTPVRRIRSAIMRDLHLPDDILSFINYPTRFDCRETIAALKGSGIACPPLDSYAAVIWDYWERHLDPDLFIDRSLRGTVQGKVVLITGGSSGIGLAAAHRFAEAGATTVICGRDLEKLEMAKVEIAERGYPVHIYAVDLADMADCDRFMAAVTAEHGGVDFLINNAGRSIRRAIEGSYERFHDFERTMQLNYFGALRVTMAALRGMTARKKGHVVNISSIGVLTNAPRFSAYVASKAALDAWTRCAASEFGDVGITFTTINMPLVRTPMIAPTKLYNNVPTLSPEEAADLIANAVVYRPVRIATRLGIFGEVLHALVPKVAQIASNTSFRMFPDSDAARIKGGGKDGGSSADQVAFQQLLRGIHF